jgi:hypothetical protein
MRERRGTGERLRKDWAMQRRGGRLSRRKHRFRFSLFCLCPKPVAVTLVVEYTRDANNSRDRGGYGMDVDLTRARPAQKLARRSANDTLQTFYKSWLLRLEEDNERFFDEVTRSNEWRQHVAAA